MTGQESKGPSIAELQRFIREKTNLEFVLSNGERLSGKLRWFDEHGFSVELETGSMTLLRTGVIGYGVKHSD
jgi:hypothetical protein